MPVDPAARAQFRVALYRIERDWYTLAQQIDDQNDKKQGLRARKILRDSIMASADVFKAKPYFLADELSLVDATIAPILWRLNHWEIELPAQAQAVMKYANLLFSRPAFRQSLSDAEVDMHALLK